MPKIKLYFKKMNNKSKLPVRKDENDAGYDCYADTIYDLTEKGLIKSNSEKVIIKPNSIVRIGLGFQTCIPKGYYGHLVPRSGLSFKHGITIINSPATIDSGYRGEWIAIVGNISNKDYEIKKGERIAQMILRKMIEFDVKVVDTLPESDRGSKGFGSSGK